MTHAISRCRAVLAMCVIAAGLFVFADGAISAASPPASAATAAPNPPAANAIPGGILAESYQYHRRGHADAPNGQPNIAPAEGWYGYGFPGSTHRWGWFGASRYYPRVVWHKGYYGDYCRWAYRSGY